MAGRENAAIQELNSALTQLREVGLMSRGGPGSAAVRVSKERFASLAARDDNAVISEIAAAAAGPAQLHAALLKTLPAAAVIHDQPVALAALGLQGVTVARCLAVEPFVSLDVAGLDRMPPDNVEKLAETIASKAAASCTVTLGRYGVVVWGERLTLALRRLLSIDHAARITHAARLSGQAATPLSERQVSGWQALGSELGWARRDPGCADCNACDNGLLGKRAGSETQQRALDAALEAVLER